MNNVEPSANTRVGGQVAGLAVLGTKTLLHSAALAGLLLSSWGIPEKIFLGSLAGAWLLHNMLSELAGDETTERRFGLLFTAIEVLEKKADGQDSTSVDTAMKDYLTSKHISDVAGGRLYQVVLLTTANFAAVGVGGWLLALAAKYLP